MTKVSTKLRQVVFFADLSMDLAVDNHQIKQRKIAIGMHVLYGKSMCPVVADCVFRRKVAQAPCCPAARHFLVTRAYDADRVGIVAVLMEMATD